MISVALAKPWAQQGFRSNDSNDQFFTVGNILARSLDQIDFNFIQMSNTQEIGSNSLSGSHFRHVKAVCPPSWTLQFHPFGRRCPLVGLRSRMIADFPIPPPYRRSA